jgi:hypothetical protein
MDQVEYTALEVARAAGFFIRPVPYGGVSRNGMLLSVGPLATDEAILELAAEYVELPARITRSAYSCECLATAHR